MVAKGTLEIANFTCKFGEHKNLMDYAEEIVIPAFLDINLKRAGIGHQPSYFFLDTKLVNVTDDDGKSVIAIAGRFIKDTLLVREQYFDTNKGLVSDEDEMRSSPSAIFVLTLDDHKLLYFGEKQHAPPIAQFGITARIFIRKKHKEYIDC